MWCCAMRGYFAHTLSLLSRPCLRAPHTISLLTAVETIFWTSVLIMQLVLLGLVKEPSLICIFRLKPAGK